VNNRQKLLWTSASLLALLIFAAIATPNLLKSRIAANQASLIGRSRIAAEQGDTEKPAGLRLASVVSSYRKLIYNAELVFEVKDIRESSVKIRQLVEDNHGEIEQMELMDASGGYVSGTIQMRVPASGLNDVVTALKKLAIRTDRENLSSRDVTREFYDNEAHLRNLRAEEQQCLEIMKQARTVKDTLEVSARLNDVRDRIERLQSQVNVMTRDVEMSQIKIALDQPTESAVLTGRWHPMHNARLAATELLEGSSEWLDWIIAMLIKLPLYLLWTFTVVTILLVASKVLLRAWRWLRPPQAVGAQA
jgi:hypothetical protein